MIYMYKKECVLKCTIMAVIIKMVTSQNAHVMMRKYHNKIKTTITN